MRNARHPLALGAALVALASSLAAVANSAAATTPVTGPSEPGPVTSAPASPLPPDSSPTTTPQVKQLSNEVTLTTWAHPEIRGWIYARPDARSRRIAPIHLLTSDGFAEVYVVLDSYVGADGEEWVKVRVPGRPNGRTGWMLRELLGGFHRTRWRIVVSLFQRHMRVYYAGRLQRVFPVGVGKPSTPTPVGHFWIDERFKLNDPSSPYWPYALGTSDYSTLSNWPGEGVVGIHGPYGEPQKIPGDPSHGCIRMLAHDISWLATRVTLGTPVDIV